MRISYAPLLLFEANHFYQQISTNSLSPSTSPFFPKVWYAIGLRASWFSLFAKTTVLELSPPSNQTKLSRHHPENWHISFSPSRLWQPIMSVQFPHHLIWYLAKEGKPIINAVQVKINLFFFLGFVRLPQNSGTLFQSCPSFYPDHQ